MSYGQPCRRMTGGPLAGPASAYPTFRSPASICFRGANDVFVPGLIGPILPDCAPAAPTMASSAAATVRTAAPKRRRRSWLISSDILALLNWIQSDVVRRGVKVRARVVPGFHVAICAVIVQRSDRKLARSSSEKACGCRRPVARPRSDRQQGAEHDLVRGHTDALGDGNG